MKTNITCNPENERLKRKYFDYLKEARGYNESTIDGIAQALSRFEAHTRYRAFKAFHFEQAKAFKRHLAELKNARTMGKLSKATVHQVVSACKAFFHWLAREPGFRSHINFSDADYFNLSDKDVAIAKAERVKPIPTIQQVLHVLRLMPTGSPLELRDRALIAFTLLTGSRDGAIASIKLKHIDIEQGVLTHDAREVKTKFSKTFPTWFFPVGDEILRIVTDYVHFLRADQMWGLDDPLFPSTLMVVGDDRKFTAAGLKRAHWSTAAPIRRIFRDAFRRAGLPSFNPHSFRNTLAQLGQRVTRSPEEFTAWSQNLGHEKVLTTFTSYGKVAPERQAEIIRQLGSSKVVGNNTAAILQRLADQAASGRLDVGP